jgi:hypothetical protein
MHRSNTSVVDTLLLLEILNTLHIVLGGVMVKVLTIGSKAQTGRFLRTIKIRSTTSFGGEVKPSVPVQIFYGILKILEKYDRDTTPAKSKDISRKLPASLFGVSAATRVPGGFIRNDLNSDAGAQ